MTYEVPEAQARASMPHVVVGVLCLLLALWTAFTAVRTVLVLNGMGQSASFGWVSMEWVLTTAALVTIQTAAGVLLVRIKR